ncbi:glycoside hydrolase [Aspergillus keveii]|uniref:Glycoside hydrolase n=1 Tax=Aspergillus keveii TaxID=714993 RepID=A0ABR4GCB4_9EURO
MRVPLQIAALVVLNLSVSKAQSVFAHYMVGTVDATTDHAQRDIADGITVGFDAFALNIGNSTADWAKSTVDQLFAAAEGSGTKFGLFFSFDMLQHPVLADHINLFNGYRDHPNYFRGGANGFPVVSSYGGYAAVNDWASFKDSADIYLIPNLDDSAPRAGDSAPYYIDPAGQLSGYDVVDGFFSWESAWPASTGGPVNVSSARDQAVMEYAHSVGKDYMMGLSSLQYKDMNGETWYRIGEANLPQRMEQILDLQPDFTKVITWNDGGESHYIGNLWEEGYSTAPEILEYANMADWPHDAWQPLITSFLTAYKDGKTADQMEPPGSASDPIGAMWYRGLLKSCSENIPANVDSAVDTVNYAIVVPAGSTDLRIRVSSGGNVLSTVDARPGLNYAALPGMAVGAQKVEVLSGDETVLSATSTSGVTDASRCNFNFNVVGLQ